MTKTITIDGKEVRLRATAALPRLYRIKFGRDIMQDMVALKNAYIRVLGADADLDNIDGETAERVFRAMDLQMFEDLAYMMARHADPDNVPDTADKWLDQFGVMSIYVVLPEILALWLGNEQTQVDSKKKLSKAAGK